MVYTLVPFFRYAIGIRPDFLVFKVAIVWPRLKVIPLK